jgi:hypothetical protein
MWLRLAQRFGIPAGELMQRMSPVEFSLHCQLEAEEPQGWPAHRVLFGQVAARVGNSAGGKRNGQPFTIDDFYPERIHRRPVAQSREAQIAILTGIFGAPPK